MTKKIFVQSKRDYALGQYREVRNAFDNIIKIVCSHEDIPFDKEDLKRVLNANDREDEMLDVFMRPICRFLRANPEYPRSSLAEMKKPYLIDFNNTRIALANLERFETVGVPFDEWEFAIKRPLPKTAYLSKVDEETLNKYLDESACVEMSDDQIEIMELTKALCDCMNQGFNPLSYIDYDNEKGGSVVQQDRLINDILKQCN